MDSEHSATSDIVSAVQGDRDAIARLLVDQSSGLTRRLTARLKLNPFAEFSVEDVLQEVFLDVFRGIKSFRVDQGTPFPAWLHKVADNRLASMLRKSSRTKRGGGFRRVHGAESSPLRSSVNMLVQRLADDRGETASHLAARDEMIGALREGLAALPDDQRAAIEKHYLHDRSLESTAGEMAKTEGAVRGLLHRAKKSLRGALVESSRWFFRK